MTQILKRGSRALAVAHALNGRTYSAKQICAETCLTLNAVYHVTHELKSRGLAEHVSGGGLLLLWRLTPSGEDALRRALGHLAPAPTPTAAPLERTTATDVIPAFVQPTSAPLAADLLTRARSGPGALLPSRPPHIRDGALDARALPSVRDGIRYWPDGRTEPI